MPILGQSNAYGMGIGLDLDGPDRPHPDVHQWAMSGPSKGSIVAGVDPLFHEVPGKGVGFDDAGASDRAIDASDQDRSQQGRGEFDRGTSVEIAVER